MQEGYVFKWRKSWYIKYYFTDVVEGNPVRRQTTKRLAPINDQYRSKKDVQGLVCMTVRGLAFRRRVHAIYTAHQFFGKL